MFSAFDQMLWSQYSKPLYNKGFLSVYTTFEGQNSMYSTFIVYKFLLIFAHFGFFFSFQGKSPFWLTKNHSCTMALLVTQHALQLQSNQSQSDLIQKDYKRGFRGIHS